MKVSLPQIVGGDYGDFWRFKGRYRVVKGGRGSKKSTTAALWLIYSMMAFYHRHGVKPSALVLRRYYVDHRETTFEQLKWAIARLQVAHLWKATKSPLQLTYLPSGQKIIFRGLDKPMSLNSITVEDGHICWVWWEEAFQVTSEDSFNKIDMSIRGKMPAPLFKQHTFTLNPWSDKHWIKRRFFDASDADTMAITRNFTSNEFLAKQDLEIFEKMRIDSPRRFAIEGEGNWGISEGLIFENWEVKKFNFSDLRARGSFSGSITTHFGLDFGYTNDPTAFVALLVDKSNNTIFIGNEIYKTGMLNSQIYAEIKALGCEHERIIADSAEPKSIAELKVLGLRGIHAAKKGADSVIAGIQRLQDFKFIVHPRCKGTIEELSTYTWSKDRMTGKLLNAPIDDYNHAMDAMRYATESINRSNFSW